QGASKVKAKLKGTVLVFVTPPTAQELGERLRKRGTETEEQIRGMYKEQATQRVKGQLVLEAIKNAEGIEATEEEVDAEIAKAAESRKKSLEDYKKTMGESTLNYFKSMTTMQKVVSFLKDNAVAPKADAE
ncbi:MAG: hypothetical protein IKS78_05760, partial [Clostridia bacterium]|nr:hypothetical protein [Clostridia bacterium]